MSSLSFNSFSLKNPNMAASPCFQLTPLHSSSPSLHFQPSSSSLVARASSRLSVDFLLPPLRPTSPFTYIVASAASRNKSASHDSQVDKNDDDLDANNEESEEAWKKALESFKEQAIHMKGVSEEAYQVYSKKAMVILEETSQQLKIQADKARKDLNSWAKEVNEAAENSPQEVKEILDTISSSTDVKDISELKDYHVGIGYGSILFAGGFATFMLVGSISAIRFGVILGGALLALGITSRRAQKNGQSYDLALKGQAAIAALLSLRKITLLFQRGTLVKIISAVISSAVFAFYCYRIGALKGNDGRGTNSAQPAEE
ncbi:Protein FATTY ACID EXPORT 3, chloroplastic [Linum grandiflorum]